MSDEFIALATKEINDEISEIETILNSCKNDDDVYQNSSQLQKHTHKIKGLAPMMGKEELGSLTAMLDLILKKIIEGTAVNGIFSALGDSVYSMAQSMSESDFEFAEIRTRISQVLNNLN